MHFSTVSALSTFGVIQSGRSLTEFTRSTKHPIYSLPPKPCKEAAGQRKNCPQQAACFAKRTPKYTSFTLSSTCFLSGSYLFYANRDSTISMSEKTHTHGGVHWQYVIHCLPRLLWSEYILAWNTACSKSNPFSLPIIYTTERLDYILREEAYNKTQVGSVPTEIYVRDYADAKIGCVPEACHLLCYHLPRELPESLVLGGVPIHTLLYCGGKLWVAPPGHTQFFTLRICWRRCPQNTRTHGTQTEYMQFFISLLQVEEQRSKFYRSGLFSNG